MTNKTRLNSQMLLWITQQTDTLKSGDGEAFGRRESYLVEGDGLLSGLGNLNTEGRLVTY